MAHLDLTPDQLRLRLSRWERVGALHGDVAIPRDAVRSVRVVPDPLRAVKGLRAPGYGLPGHASVGTWRGRGWKDFVVAYSGRPGVVIELRRDRPEPDFRRLVVSVENPETVAAALG